MNWDKLEHEVKLEEKDEKLDGEQALQKLFRDIYSGADEDTRRAMNKSFQVRARTIIDAVQHYIKFGQSSSYLDLLQHTHTLHPALACHLTGLSFPGVWRDSSLHKLEGNWS